MLKTLLKDWKGEIIINDVSVDASNFNFNALSDSVHIILHSSVKNAAACKIDTDMSMIQKQEYRVTVKKYMTEKSNPGFDFMAKFNNDTPMPLRTMTGTIEKETRGMVYMKLHGQAEPVVRCMRCGRLLTNPTSQIYGIGPECMAKLGLVRIEIDDVETIKKRLVDITWEGWVIKSAIIEKEEAC